MEYSSSLKDKNIIVTGANTGIGYETALDFAKRGANVILACRNQEKADKACSNIKYESQNDNIEVELVDLSSLKSTREFADRIIAKWNRLDILVNNAGLILYQHSLTEEGFETVWATNYLGPFLLTRLLLDLLKKSEPSRIINVSSEAHRQTKMKWENLNYENTPYKSLAVYSQSKLAQILSTVELADRLKDTNVSVVSLHPGVIPTEFMRERDNQPWFVIMVKPCVSCCGKSVTNGAQTTIHCATSDKIPSQSGLYFSDSKVKRATSYAMDKSDAERLWKVTSQMVGLDE